MSGITVTSCGQTRNAKTNGQNREGRISLGKKEILLQVSPSVELLTPPEANPSAGSTSDAPELVQKRPTQSLEAIRNQFLLGFPQGCLHGFMAGAATGGTEVSAELRGACRRCLLFGRSLVCPQLVHSQPTHLPGTRNTREEELKPPRFTQNWVPDCQNSSSSTRLNRYCF